MISSALRSIVSSRSSIWASAFITSWSTRPAVILSFYGGLLSPSGSWRSPVA